MSMLRSKRSVCELAGGQESSEGATNSKGANDDEVAVLDLSTYSRKRRATPPLVLHFEQATTAQTAYSESRRNNMAIATSTVNAVPSSLQPSSISSPFPSTSSSSCFSTAPPAANPAPAAGDTSNPSSLNSTTALQPTSFASRRHNKNNKQLFLVVPGSSSTSDSTGRIPLSPTSQHQLDISETKSCPPTPRFVLDTDANQPAVDPSKAETLKSALRGDMTMKRRTSLPRLNIKANLRLDTGKSTCDRELPPPTPSISQCPATANSITMVTLVGRNKEAGAPVAESESPEDFPYQNGPREILPNLFLGSEHNAKDLETLRRYNITTVICVAKEVACPWQSDETIEESDETDEGTDSFGSDSDQEDKSIEQHSSRNGNFLVPPSINTPCHPSASSSRSASPLVRSTASTPNLQQRFHQQEASASSARKSPCRTSTYTSQPRTSTSHPSVFRRRFTQSRLLGRPALQYTKLPWGHDEDNIASQFTSHQICEMIDQARENGGNCLVHCQLGVSRSATLMIGYCMRQASLGSEPALSDIKTMHDSYSYVRGKSRWVAPNIGLLAQLVQYERILQSASSDQKDLPYTNSAYYDSQASLYTSTPDNLSPSSTTESSDSKDSSLGTPDPNTSIRQYGLSTPPKFRHAESSFDEQLSPMTAAIRITKHSDYGTADGLAA